MKAERWYDVRCDECGFYMSTDFREGMRATRKDAVATAKRLGFKDVKGRTLCPYCLSGEKGTIISERR